MIRKTLLKVLLITMVITWSFAHAQSNDPDPLESMISVDGLAVYDSINPDDTTRFRALNLEMGMYEPVTPIKNYLGIKLEKGHIVVLDKKIINVVLRPLSSISANYIKKKLRKEIPRMGVFFSDNGIRYMWATTKYTIEYTYGENTKWIYIYDNPQKK